MKIPTLTKEEAIRQIYEAMYPSEVKPDGKEALKRLREAAGMKEQNG